MDIQDSPLRFIIRNLNNTGREMSDFDYANFIYIIEENLFVSYLDISVNGINLGNISLNTEIVSSTVKSNCYLTSASKL